MDRWGDPEVPIPTSPATKSWIRCCKLFGPFKLQVDLPRDDSLEQEAHARAQRRETSPNAGSPIRDQDFLPTSVLVVCALDPPFGRYRGIASVPVRTGEDRLPEPRAAAQQRQQRLLLVAIAVSPSANRGLTAADTLEFPNHAGWNVGDRSRATGPGTTVRLLARRFEVFA